LSRPKSPRVVELTEEEEEEEECCESAGLVVSAITYYSKALWFGPNRIFRF
jgi:hypothetical protein